jgi:hypothetical protein
VGEWEAWLAVDGLRGGLLFVLLVCFRGKLDLVMLFVWPSLVDYGC